MPGQGALALPQETLMPVVGNLDLAEVYTLAPLHDVVVPPKCGTVCHHCCGKRWC